MGTAPIIDLSSRRATAVAPHGTTGRSPAATLSAPASTLAWRWNMQPHDLRCAMRMRENGASCMEIGRALGFPGERVRRMLSNDIVLREFTRWWLTVSDEAQLRCAVHLRCAGASPDEIVQHLGRFPHLLPPSAA